MRASLADWRPPRRAALPFRVGDYWYLRRSLPGHTHGQVCRRPALSWRPPRADAAARGWQVVADGTALAARTGHADVRELLPSPDGRCVAFTVDTSGSGACDLVVVDGAGREVDRVHDVAARFAWWPDTCALVYTTVDERVRPDTAWVHRLGADRASDAVAHHVDDPARWLGAGTSTSGRYLLLLTGSADDTEWHALDGTPAAPTARLLLPRRPGVRDQVDHAVLGGRDAFVVLRRAPGTDDALFALPADDALAGRAGAGRSLLTGSTDVRLEHLSACADALVVNARDGGVPHARIYRPPGPGEPLGNPLREVRSAWAARPDDWRQPFVRVTRRSWTAPAQVLDVPTCGGRTRLRRATAVPATYRAAEHRVERLLVPSSQDGTMIPLTVLDRSGLPRTAPLLLTVYGAYGHSTDAGLDPERVTLLARGMRVAVAHVRGGGELGPAWHEAACGTRRELGLGDFVDCARHLVSEGWTSSRQLVVHGTSAGGLVVAVAANRAPQLFAGVIAEVPFVDPLTSMLDPSAPLTSLETTKWGDPGARSGGAGRAAWLLAAAERRAGGLPADVRHGRRARLAGQPPAGTGVGACRADGGLPAWASAGASGGLRRPHRAERSAAARPRARGAARVGAAHRRVLVEALALDAVVTDQRDRGEPGEPAEQAEQRAGGDRRSDRRGVEQVVPLGRRQHRPAVEPVAG